MRLLMIRHPVTIANTQGIVQHNVEGGIAPRGYEQIEKLLSRLEKEHFDKGYSSDAYRCRVLAETISTSKGIIIEYNPLFREINNGCWIRNKIENIKRLSLENPLNARPENGESLQDLVNRATQGIEIIKSGGGERNFLISHGWFLKLFLGLQLGMNPLDAVKYLKFSNCAISEIELNEAGCLVEYLNNRDYLK